MILTQENKCAMCGKHAIVRDEHDNKNGREQQEQGNKSSTSIMIVEQIDGTYYSFDTANCALTFKKFREVYGSSFIDE